MADANAKKAGNAVVVNPGKAVEEVKSKGERVRKKGKELISFRTVRTVKCLRAIGRSDTKGILNDEEYGKMVAYLKKNYDENMMKLDNLRKGVVKAKEVVEFSF